MTKAFTNREAVGFFPPSERQMQVLLLICEGFSTKEIGLKLGISPRTVEGHKSDLYWKFGTNNIVGLVLAAFRNGVVR